jgi:hypothetical protein
MNETRTAQSDVCGAAITVDALPSLARSAA